MGTLIATAQATLDGVIDPVGEWVQPEGDHGEYSFERQAASSGLVLGRKTYEGLAGYWPNETGKWADMVNAMPKYVGSTTLSGELGWRGPPHLSPSVLRRNEPRSAPHAIRHVHRAVAEAALVDELEIQVQIGREGRLSGADHHREEH